MVTVGEDTFELQQWVGGEQFSTAHPRSLDWVAYAAMELGRIHQVSQHYAGPEYRWPSEVHMGAQVQGVVGCGGAPLDQQLAPLGLGQQR